MARVYGAKPYRVTAGIGAGAGAALAMIVVMAALRLTVGFPTIPELMLSPILLLLGGQAFSTALDTFYYMGRPLLYATVLEGTLLLGVLLGLLYAWLARPNPLTGRRHSIFDTPVAGLLYGLLLGFLLNVLFLPIVGQLAFASQPLGLYAASPIPLWAGMFILALIFGLTLHSLLPKAPAPIVAESTSESSAAYIPAAAVPTGAVDRRYFTRLAGGTLLAVVGGVFVTLGGTILNQGGLVSPVNRSNVDEAEASELAQAAESTPTPEPPTSTAEPINTPLPTDTPEPTGTRVMAQSTEPATGTPEPPTNTPEPTATAVPTDTATTVPTVEAHPAIKVKELTPVESFYHVSKNFFDPSPKAEGWKLAIKGLVGKPYSLTYEQLTALPAITVTTGMMCISNPIGGGLAGSTTWKGVRLADLIKKAVPKKGVVDVVMRAADDYSDSITITKALDPNVMLVWEMGGAKLTSQHGFPARLLVPGIYGMKHLKWLTSLELVDYDYKGYWQQPSQGWSDPAPVNTMSRIDFPANGTLDLKPQAISGIAFAGDRSISKVEISSDGGKSWEDAYVKPPKSSTSWVVWGYTWKPAKAGKYSLMVRATDGKGKLQVAKKSEPYPDGATGYHTVSYMVKGKAGEAPAPGEAAPLGVSQPRKSVLLFRDSNAINQQ